MFGYRHIFHAGNHADVFKHVVLVGLLDALKRKDSGFCVLDTHAGIALYDLNSEQAQLNREFDEGVGRIWCAPGRPALVQQYIDTVQMVNDDGRLSVYPGSPMIARKLIRPQDTMILTELNKADCAALQSVFARDKQVAVHLQDAYQGLNAFLPPRLKRGLVLIDPPYELRQEVDDLTRGLQHGHKKWPTGVYAIWYPVFEPSFVEHLHRRIKALAIPKILNCTLTVRQQPEQRRMIGSGMLIVNPPWQFDDQMRETLPWLQAQLAQGGGRINVDWLVPE